MWAACYTRAGHILAIAVVYTEKGCHYQIFFLQSVTRYMKLVLKLAF